jgi:hypothetical protein
VVNDNSLPVFNELDRFISIQKDHTQKMRVTRLSLIKNKMVLFSLFTIKTMNCDFGVKP